MYSPVLCRLCVVSLMMSLLGECRLRDTEALRAYQSVFSNHNLEEAKRAIMALEDDGGGIHFDHWLDYIVGEWVVLYKENSSTQQLRRLFRQADVNSDGALSFDEFSNLIRQVDPTRAPREVSHHVQVT
eukprot:GFYU01004693.1.p2 GENE.GFYU01004693.1~~GFYU01004693.1.p2  ORF type:complete len:129 (-),score=28.34 GFYU01004693.1:630-1016(-)